MSKLPTGCEFIIDLYGLREVSKLGGNHKAMILNALDEGRIVVSTVTWNAFKEIFPEEAESIKDWINHKVRNNAGYQSCTASLAEKLNSSLSNSPYEDHSELVTGAISQTHGITVLTAVQKIDMYEEFECECEDILNWND